MVEHGRYWIISGAMVLEHSLANHVPGIFVNNLREDVQDVLAGTIALV